MEGTPNTNTESVENIADYRELMEQAPAAAEALIAEIEGFVEMETANQIAALKELHEGLISDCEENCDNSQRYLVGEVKRRITKLEESTIPQLSNQPRVTIAA
ncbi:MAG: hypothetical protein KJO86_04060 [Muriicola sp.]|nr:hypothetical protein [Muriicola sp.]